MTDFFGAFRTDSASVFKCNGFYIWLVGVKTMEKTLFMENFIIIADFNN